MANHKSAKKRIRQTVTRNTRNRANRSRARTAVKAFREALEKNADNAQTLLQKATSELAIAARKGALPQARVNRLISRLSKAKVRQNASAGTTKTT